MDSTCFCDFDKVKPLLPHLHPGDAFSRQVRVDGGELATDFVVVHHLLDGWPHLLHTINTLGAIDHKLALITSGRATSAVFQNFQEHIGLQFLRLKGSITHEEKSLGMKNKGGVRVVT